MTGLNLSQFQKVKEDKKSTTLKHKDGHTMIIVHSALPKIQKEQLKRLKLAEGTPDGDVGDTKDQQQDAPPPAQAAPSVNINVGTPAQQAPPIPQQSMQNPAGAQVVQPKIPQNLPNPVNPNGEFNAPAAAKMSQAGQDLGAQVSGEQAKANAQNQQAFLNESNRLAQIDASNINDMKQHTAAFDTDYRNADINAKRYLENRPFVQKVSNSLGVLLGGLGQGLIGGNNPAMDFIDKQIDRDINAQKENADHVRNVWGAYNQLYQNQNVATNLAKVSANNILVHQAEKVAADLGTPQAQANLLQLKAKTAAENNKMFLDSSGLLRNGPNAQGAPQEQSAPAQGASGSQGVMNNSAHGASAGWNPMGSTAEASLPPKEEEKEDWYDKHLLASNADKILESKKYGAPKDVAQFPEIQKQWQNASVADESYSKLNDIYKELTAHAAKSGELGNIRRHFGPHLEKLPFGVGEAINGPLQYVTDTQANRLYDTSKTSLVGAMSSALRGTNVGGGQIEDIVNKNIPENGDSAADIMKKRENLKNFIKEHIDTSLLRHYKMAK